MSAVQTDAFRETAAPIKEPENLYALYLRETHGLPDEWDWYEASSAPGDVPDGFVRFRGAVAPLKRNGSQNWRKMDKATDRTLFVVRADYEAWCLARAERLDECLVCRGTGQRVVSVGVDGVKREPCRKCRSTGKHFAPPVPA